MNPVRLDNKGIPEFMRNYSFNISHFNVVRLLETGKIKYIYNCRSKCYEKGYREVTLVRTK